eukprot:scaffold86674_cov38-Prasinocladus_malaysianus.AAC.1
MDVAVILHAEDVKEPVAVRHRRGRLAVAAHRHPAALHAVHGGVGRPYAAVDPSARNKSHRLALPHRRSRVAVPVDVAPRLEACP